MAIVHRYLLKESLKILALVLTVVVGIYVMVDFLEKIDDFTEVGLPLSRIGVYLGLKLPFIVTQVLPVALLLAVLIVLGLMTKNNEILALRSSGISVWYLLRSTLALGVATSVTLLLVGELLVPPTLARANIIWLKEVRRTITAATSEKNIWIKNTRSIVHIRFAEPAKRLIHGVSINRFDAAFHLVERIDAKQGQLQDGRWLLSDGLIQTRNASDGHYRVAPFAQRPVDLQLDPGDLVRVARRSEEMGILDLHAFIRKVRDDGYDATRYMVDFHGKLAMPVVCIIMVLVAMSIAVRRQAREGLPMSIAIGLGIAFAYWISHSFAMSLGYAELLPPIVAAWITNGVFVCLGGYLLLHVE